MLKFNYHITQETLLNAETVAGLIVTEMESRKYIVNRYGTHTIDFEYDPWRFRWNWEKTGQMNSGQFTIETTGNAALVTLNCFYNYTWPVLLLTVTSIIMLVQGEYPGIIFFGAFILITSAFDFTKAKSNMREILRTVS